MKVASCPLCGDEMKRETGEKARNAVIAHASSKNDPDHSGVGYQKAANLLGIHSDESGSMDADPESVSMDPEMDPVENRDAPANGGARPVPMPDDVPDDDPSTPEKFVPVNEWLSAFERRNQRTAETDAWEEQAAEIRERADYVDAEETDGREIVAVPEAEVPA